MLKKINRIIFLMLFCFLALLLTNNTNAETIDDVTIRFNEKYGSDSADYLEEIIQTKDGNYIAVGYTSGQVQGGTSHGTIDGWIIKIDANGNEIWSQQYGNSSFDHFKSLVEIANNKIVVVGNKNCMSKDSVGDAWLAQISLTNGAIEKERTYQIAINDLNDIYKIIKTNDNNFVFVGMEENGADYNYYGTIFKVDSNYDLVKARHYAYQNTALKNYLYSVVETSDGSYLAVGRTDKGFVNGLAAKFEKNLNLVFEKTYYDSSTPSSFVEINDVVKMADGGYALVGNTNGDYNGNINKGYNDGLLIKIDNNGNEEYSKMFGGQASDKVMSVKETIDGGLILAGHYNFVLTKGAGVGGFDGLAIKLDISKRLHFNSNGGTGTMNSLVVNYNDSLGLPANQFNKDNHEFIGWALTKSDADNGIISHYDQNTYLHNQAKSVTLYASWKKVNDTSYISTDDGSTNTAIPNSAIPNTGNEYIRLSLVSILVAIVGIGLYRKNN